MPAVVQPLSLAAPPTRAIEPTLQELRIAKETQQHQPGTDSDHSDAKNGHHARGDEDDGDRDDEPPKEQGCFEEEEKAALKEEARKLREELAAVNAQAEVYI